MTRNTNKTKEFSEKNSKCGSVSLWAYSGEELFYIGVCRGLRQCAIDLGAEEAEALAMAMGE